MARNGGMKWQTRPVVLRLFLRGGDTRSILVMIGGFSVLSFVTVLTYTNAPPIPDKAVDAAGNVVFTGADIQKGQEVFFKYGLMEHGTLWGHGAYLGPDYSAEYLHRLSEVTRDTIAVEKYGRPFAQLSPDEQIVASAEVRRVLKENRYEPASRTLLFTPGEVAAFRTQTVRMERLLHQEGRRPWTACQLYQGPHGAQSADRLFRVGRLGGVGEPAGQGLFLHEQLAL